MVGQIYDDMTEEEEREAWMRLALESLARAYADDEPEYSLDRIIEFNPDYVPLSQAEQDELDRRVDAYRQNPEAGVLWEHVQETMKRG